MGCFLEIGGGGLAWVVVARHTDPKAKPLKDVFQRGHQRGTPKRHDL